jgi:hypothetical protein
MYTSPGPARRDGSDKRDAVTETVWKLPESGANANKALIKESSTPRGDATTFGRARRRHGRATLTRFEV